MDLKLKTLGLGLVAVLATSAVVAMSASATGTGHFTSAVKNTHIYAEQESGSKLSFTDPTLPALGCNVAFFDATFEPETVTSLTFTPTFDGCSTSAGQAHVKTNGCDFIATIETKASKDNLVLIDCPEPKKLIEIEATNIAGKCTIKLGEQITEGGVVYTTAKVGETHLVTADLTISGIDSIRHPDGFGACLFVTTNGAQGALTGSLTAEGRAPNGDLVNITATGSED